MIQQSARGQAIRDQHQCGPTEKSHPIQPPQPRMPTRPTGAHRSRERGWGYLWRTASSVSPLCSRGSVFGHVRVPYLLDILYLLDWVFLSVQDSGPTTPADEPTYATRCHHMFRRIVFLLNIRYTFPVRSMQTGNELHQSRSTEETHQRPR